MNHYQGENFAVRVSQFIRACQRCAEKLNNAFGANADAQELRLDEADIRLIVGCLRWLPATVTIVSELQLREPRGLRFMQVPLLSGFGGGSEMTEEQIEELRESECLLECVDRAAEDTLWQVRACESCGTWFEAAKRDQRFCKKGCRQRTFNTSPEQRAKNAAYQRERYRKHFAAVRPPRRASPGSHE